MNSPKITIVCLCMVCCLVRPGECLAARRQVSHQDRVYVEIGILVSGIAAGIYFFTRPDVSGIQARDSLDTGCSKPGKPAVSLNIFRNLLLSPDKLVSIRW